LIDQSFSYILAAGFKPACKENAKLFAAMKFEAGALHLIDQRYLPLKESWIVCKDVEVIANAIETMVVRGAPAIGCAAAFGLKIHADHSSAKDWAEYQSQFQIAYDRLARTRPTAINLFFAIKKFKELTSAWAPDLPITMVRSAFGDLAQHLYDDDIRTCKAIGDYGQKNAPSDSKVNVLTHCNTGSLATAGYGTALGVIRSLHKAGKLGHVYVDETRPYMQGTRLTTFELTKDNIPFELIVDSAAAALMAAGRVDWVIVGADRIAANGDTANKIGTYSCAVNAHYHDVAFYVAAPLSTFDVGIASGKDIPVEQRPGSEITQVLGHQVAPESTRTLNPSFDVTPATLITGIITEKGVLRPPFTESISKAYSSL
jgi:methylthioribose-1-phosphate isomerase